MWVFMHMRAAGSAGSCSFRSMGALALGLLTACGMDEEEVVQSGAFL